MERMETLGEEPHRASATADTDLEAARWDAVEDKLGPVRESCNGVLAGESLEKYYSYSRQARAPLLVAAVWSTP